MKMRKARLSEQRRTAIKRIAVYSAWFFLIAVVESSFFANVSALPTSPRLILPAIAAIALLDNKKNTVIAAIIGGTVESAIGTSGIYFLPLFYLLSALLLCLVAKKMLPKYPSFLVLLPITLVLTAGYDMLTAFLFAPHFDAMEVLLSTVVPRTVETAIFALGLFFLIGVSISPLIDRRTRSLG